MRDGDDAAAGGLVAFSVDGAVFKGVDAPIGSALTFGSEFDTVATEDDVGLGVAVALVVDRLVAGRRKEGDLDISVARVGDAVFTCDGVELVVGGPELGRLVAGLGWLGVGDGELGFAFDDAGVLAVIGGLCGHDDLVRAHGERTFFIDAQVDVVARGFGQIVRGFDVNGVGIAHAILTLDGEGVGAEPLFGFELAGIFDAGRLERGLTGADASVAGASGDQCEGAQGADNENDVFEDHESLCRI